MSIRVLVVEDEDDLRTSVASLLEAAGYEVREAADGDAALRILDDNGVTVMILDIRMPRRDGIAVLDALEKPPAVVLVSAHRIDDELRTRVGPKVYQFLHKPVPPRQLLEAVAGAASHRRAP